MKNPIILALALAWAVPAVAQPPPILPGYWESQNKVSFPVNDETTSRQCVTADKIIQFLSGPSTRRYRCDYARSQVADGAIAASGNCVDKSGLKSTIDVRGTYTPTTFQLNAQLRIDLGGVPIPVRASTDARRISAECPAEAK